MLLGLCATLAPQDGRCDTFTAPTVATVNAKVQSAILSNLKPSNFGNKADISVKDESGFLVRWNGIALYLQSKPTAGTVTFKTLTLKPVDPSKQSGLWIATATYDLGPFSMSSSRNLMLKALFQGTNCKVEESSINCDTIK